jgi:hypothetical protein
MTRLKGASRSDHFSFGPERFWTTVKPYNKIPLQGIESQMQSISDLLAFWTLSIVQNFKK